MSYNGGFQGFFNLAIKGGFNGLDLTGCD